MVYLVWRFRSQRSISTDDFNHWGLVARHLLRHDRFPNSVDEFIRFQSYPLGTACFIYFIGKPFAESEGLFFIGHHLLAGILLLPMFSLVKNKKRALYPIVAVIFLVYFSFGCSLNALKVDMHLTFWGIGMAASIAHYRNDFNRMAGVSILPMIAVTYCKNSGMFIAACTALMLIYFAKSHHRGSKRLYALLIALPFACYLIWTVSMKIRFPNALQSKHSISPALYLANLRKKSLRSIVMIALSMFVSFFAPYPKKIGVLCMTLPLLILLLISAKTLSARQKRQCRNVCLFSVALYLTWYLLLYFMYIFSMPLGEAVNLGSFSRYDLTAFSYAAGLCIIASILALQAALPLARPQRLGAYSAVTLGAVAMLILAICSNDYVPARSLYRQDGSAHRYRLRERSAPVLENNDLPIGGDYLVYSDVTYNAHYIFRFVEYELETANIYQICRTEDYPGQYLVGYREVRKPVSDVQEILAEEMGSVDALLIFDGSEEFIAELEKFQAANPTDTPTYFINTD